MHDLLEVRTKIHTLGVTYVLSTYVQGVRGQSGFFNWALTERNIQVRLYLKIVLKS